MAKKQNNDIQASQRLDRNSISFPLKRANLIGMAIAGLLIIIGFMLMLGGKSTESAFNPDIFSARRIVIGPTVTLAGFIAMAIAIIWKSRDKKVSTK